MKTPGAIRHKLNQVRFRHLSRYLDENLKQIPCNCRFNVSLPQTTSGAEPPNVCIFGADKPATWKASYCDERVDQGKRSRDCPFFQPVVPKEELKSSFMEDLAQMRLSDVAYHYPDMAALLWVLDAEDIITDESEYPEVMVEPLTQEVPFAAEPVAAEPMLAQQEKQDLQAWRSVDLLPIETVKKPWYARWISA